MMGCPSDEWLYKLFPISYLRSSEIGGRSLLCQQGKRKKGVRMEREIKRRCGDKVV